MAGTSGGVGEFGILRLVHKKLRAFGEKLARESGIRRIRAGERRPDQFYLVNHATGVPFVPDRGAVVFERDLQSRVTTAGGPVIERRP